MTDSPSDPAYFAEVDRLMEEMKSWPLLNTDAASLDRVFGTDPMTHPPKDHCALVLELRRRRSEFLSSEAAKVLAPKKPRAKADPLTSAEAARLDKPVSEIGLDDI